jgi:hypothetical protein
MMRLIVTARMWWEVDSGQRRGPISEGKKRIAELEREVRELRRASVDRAISILIVVGSFVTVC